LWKDHSSLAEAEAINLHAEKFEIDYLADVGGIYSSEWFWAKLLHILRVDDSVRNEIYTWVEQCDWIPFLLTGGQSASQLKRGRCSAGHKALWSPRFGGYPPNEFFKSLDPLLDGLVDRLPAETYTADQPAGKLCPEWAERLGLSTDVVVGIGAFDAHMGAVGGQIIPFHLSKVMGTSTCDMMVAPVEGLQDRTVRGICGQVEGSIIPGMMGLEAGQSAFGDVYAWLARVLAEPAMEMISLTTSSENISFKDLQGRLLNYLLDKAAQLPVREDLPLAVDWLNGRRTPDAHQGLKAAIRNLDLSTGIAEISYALVEATCFGARAITDRFADEGVPVQGIIGLGGVARKSPFIMQLLANVLQMPIRIHKSDQTCALGAAMFAATAAGVYPRVEEAMEAMGPGFESTIEPDAALRDVLNKRYHQYRKLGEAVSYQ
jgi:L-ribulokinase